MATASKQGRCRHPGLAGGVGAAIGLAGVAASHYFAYLAAVETAAQSYAVSVEVARDQLGFWNFIGARVEQGWSISRSFSDGGGMPISGVFVYLVWLVEAGVLAGSGAYGGWVLANAPYCESCDR